MKTAENQRSPDTEWLRSLGAVLLGLTIPAMLSGRAVLQTFVGLALITAIVIAVREPRVRGVLWHTLRSRAGLVIFVAFVGMAVNIPGSLDPLRSFEGWGRTLIYIVGCALFWAVLQTDDRTRKYCHRTFIGGMAFAAVVILLAQESLVIPELFDQHFILPLRILKNVWVPVNGAWGNTAPKAFAAVAACCVPVLFWLGSIRHGWARWAVFGVATMSVVFIIGTVNKSALAGILAAVLVVTFAVAIRNGRGWLFGWAALALGATASVLLLVYELPDEPSSVPVWDWIPPEIVDTHRQQIWTFTAGKISEAPWTGYGINVINRLPGANDVIPGYHAEKIPSHPHNWVLEVLGETGLVGFVPMLFALAWLAGRQFLRYLRFGEGAPLAQLGLMAVFWASSLLNFSIWSSWWLISYFLLTALVGAGPPAVSPPRRDA